MSSDTKHQSVLQAINDSKSPMNIQAIRNLVPICELTNDNLQDLMAKTEILELPAGRPVFKRGDNDNYSYYLLEGQLTLLDADSKGTAISGGTQQARFPLDHHRPRQATAIAETSVRYVRIDNDLLDILLTWDQNAGYMVTEIDEDDSDNAEDDSDWMGKLLRSHIFHRIPAGNIQTVFMRMEEVEANAGDDIIRQGEAGDYYYYLKEGRCVVTRKSAKSGKTLKLAELDAGSSFGEEALLANAKRNATVTMLTDGKLMRLGKEDFDALLKAPVLQKVNFAQAREMVGKGAVLLDVRLESEHKNSSIKGSINIPLYMLRLKASTLNKHKTYIVYCDTGRRSASATYLLNERNINAYLLDGGLMALKSGESK